MTTSKMTSERIERIKRMSEQLVEGRHPLAVKYDRSNMPPSLSSKTFLEINFMEATIHEATKEAFKKKGDEIIKRMSA